MYPHFRRTDLVFFTLLVAMASPLHGQVPGELGADDLTGIREAHLAGRWSDGLTGGNPVELDPAFTSRALRLPREASASGVSAFRETRRLTADSTPSAESNPRKAARIARRAAPDYSTDR